MPHSRSVPLPTLRRLLARVHLRLILFAVLLATISLMVSGALIIRTYMYSNQVLAAGTVAYTVEPAMVFEDRQAMDEAIATVTGFPSIDRIEVLDPAGKLLADWQRPHQQVRGWLVSTANRWFWPRPTVTAVNHSGTRIGTVKIYGNSGGILRFLLAALIISLSCLALSVVGTRILARRLQQGVVGPLEQVARIAHQVRESRAFDQRVPAAGIAEIDRFGQDFNALLAELQAWHSGVMSENAELKRRARHDELTGLGNRALFERALGDEVEAGRPVGLICVDIDQFKDFNLEHGRESGDAALIAVAERLRTVLRNEDSAYRLGGDEFALLLKPAPEPGAFSAVLDWISVAMDDTLRLPSGDQVRVSVSCGHARFPDDADTIDELLRRADSAMGSHT